MAEIPHVQTPVTNYARSLGWRARRMQYIGRHACPDSWFFKNGRVIIIEFKEIGEEPKIHQEREIRRLRESGMEVHVIDNVEDGRALFN